MCGKCQSEKLRRECAESRLEKREAEMGGLKETIRLLRVKIRNLEASKENLFKDRIFRKKRTQVILEYLKEYPFKGLTSKEAKEKLNVIRLDDVISELRGEGYNIKTKLQKTDYSPRKRARYYIQE